MAKTKFKNIIKILLILLLFFLFFLVIQTKTDVNLMTFVTSNIYFLNKFHHSSIPFELTP